MHSVIESSSITQKGDVYMDNKINYLLGERLKTIIAWNKDIKGYRALLDAEGLHSRFLENTKNRMVSDINPRLLDLARLCIRLKINLSDLFSPEHQQKNPLDDRFKERLIPIGFSIEIEDFVEAASSYFIKNKREFLLIRSSKTFIRYTVLGRGNTCPSIYDLAEILHMLNIDIYEFVLFLERCAYLRIYKFFEPLGHPIKEKFH